MISPPKNSAPSRETPATEPHPESEHTPLLDGTSSHNVAASNGNDAPATRPDDYLNGPQILLLSYTRMIDPVAFFCIVPFINQMIYDLNEFPESDVGFYSGLIESLFSVVQMVVMTSWGKAADNYGRKTIMVISLAGLLVTSTLFGFSKSLWQMILLRCAAGIFSGSLPAARAMITENSAPKTQARAFSTQAVFGNVGIFLGVIVGGLAKPAEQFPGLFGNVKFFQDFPYALPTIISGALILSALLVTIFFIEETLDKETLNHPSHGAPMSTWEVITSPGVPTVLFTYVMAGILGMGFTAVVPVYWFTSIKNGGYSLPPKIISYLIALGGISQAIWMLVVFPPLQKRVGTGGVLRLCAYVWPISFALSPLGNAVLRHGLTTVFWSVTPVAIVMGSFCAMAFTGVVIIVNDASPTPAALGTLNGFALALSSGARAITPAALSSLFAIGVREHILWGQFIWVVLIALALVYGLSLIWLPAKAEGRYEEVPQTEDGDRTA